MKALPGGHRPYHVVRSKPEIQAILNAPDDLRRECIVVAASQSQWEGTELLSYIARNRAGLSLEDIEAVLPPVRLLMDSQGAWRAGERMRPSPGRGHHGSDPGPGSASGRSCLWQRRGRRRRRGHVADHPVRHAYLLALPAHP